MKKCILLIFILLLTGCSATYDIEIYNDKVKEDLIYIESDSSKISLENEVGLTYSDYLRASWTFPYPAHFGEDLDEDPSIIIPGVEYYKKTKIDDETGLGERLQYNKFKFSDFDTSNIARECYQFFNVLEDDDSIVISTSSTNLCFDKYSFLDSIVINLKTNHKVIENNANKVNGYHYSWYFTRSEKDEATIYIKLDKRNYVFNYENEFYKNMFIILITVGIIVVIGGSSYLYFKNKNEKLNKI